MKPRLKERYLQEIRPALMKQFGIENPMAVPTLSKIVINMGCKGAVETKARIDAALRDMAAITGQKPTVRKARKSISSFKLREGMPIGVAVTLRKDRMWEFTDRLISVVPPTLSQSIFTGCPCCCRCHSENARANSYRIASLCGVMMTTVPSAGPSPAFSGRNRNGSPTTAASARMMSARFMEPRQHTPSLGDTPLDRGDPNPRLPRSPL